MTFKESIKEKLIIAANEYFKLVGFDFVIAVKYITIYLGVN